MNTVSDNRMHIKDLQYVIRRKLAFQVLPLYLFEGIPGFIDGKEDSQSMGIIQQRHNLRGHNLIEIR